MAREDCPNCSGTGWKVVEQPEPNQEARAFAPADGAHAGSAPGEPKTVWAMPCDCTVGDRDSRILKRARIPIRYLPCDFDNFEADNDYEGFSPSDVREYQKSLSQAKLIVSGFSRDFSVGTEQGFLLTGPVGTGKTHLAVAALKAIVARGFSGLFYDYRKLLKQIQDSYNRETNATEMQTLTPVLKCDLLMLDDFGVDRASDWVRDTIGYILNDRYNDKRPTIITTNYPDSLRSRVAETRSPSEMSQTVALNSPPDSILYGTPTPREETLTDRIGTRIRSRLYEMCRTVDISAPDYRQYIRDARHFNV